ncbi:hypothetical protein EXS56_01060 [Candidatus Kaiserbacteria bacterium]|nr:hypothetical protein [Candidatus Kaiserbacteria bacterium]
MFGMHLGRAREKIVAVADIGSGSAALAIVAVSAEGPVRVLCAERRFLPLEERTTEAITAALGTHLVEVGKSVLAVYQKSGGSAPESVYAIVRAPWTRSKTVEARTSFPEVTQITDKIIGGLAQQALASDKEFDRAHILEAGVIRIEVNGYPTGEPEGASGHRLSVAALISDCDPTFKTTLTSALQQLFGGQKVVIRSGVHAILSILRNKADAWDKNFLVVDMASEGTNFVVIRDGITTDHATIPEGKNSILKRISGNGMTEETLTLLRLLARGECHDPACEAIQVAMAKAEPELVRTFGEVIAKLVVQQRLPNHLILATHQDLVPWLSSFFSRIDFAQFTTTTQPFVVTPLKPADLTHLALPEPGIHADTGILIAAALVNIEEGRV